MRKKKKRLLKPNYDLWLGMKQRCSNPNHLAYHNYGGRGIKVCERWLTYDNFMADMGPRPTGMTIDRINNSLGYEPSNCRWATRVEQSANTRSSVNVTLRGVTKTLTQWAEAVGMRYPTLRSRMALGWDFEKIIDMPVRPSKKYKRRAA